MISLPHGGLAIGIVGALDETETRGVLMRAYTRRILDTHHRLQALRIGDELRQARPAGDRDPAAVWMPVLEMLRQESERRMWAEVAEVLRERF